MNVTFFEQGCKAKGMSDFQDLSYAPVVADLAYLPPEFHLLCCPFSTTARERKMDAEVTGVAEDGEVSVKSLANRAVAIFPFESMSRPATTP